ncbi:MAG: GNAT family N-acetyltransferase [Planctomycetes bacterium]|nr:GNAT family N-acetyltransferase [Planctomycetota bacterium]
MTDAMDTAGLEVRTLKPADAAEYAAWRRAMLIDSPRAYTADPSTDLGCDQQGVAASLVKEGYALVGAFIGGRLIGSAGVLRETRAKLSHRVLIWGVGVDPMWRGRGVGRRVTEEAVRVARSWPGVRVVHLSVTETQTAARAMYERLGFVAWGTEPCKMIVDGEELSDVYMMMRVDRRGD